MKTSYLIIALILLIVVLGFSYYYTIQPEKKETKQETVIEEIEEVPVAKATVKTEAVTPAEEEAEKPEAAVIEIKDGLFIPAEITINEGETVTWVNKDTRTHKVAAYSRHFYGNLMKPGDSYSFAFNYSGVYKYFDVIFSKTMKNGIVRVEPRLPVTGGAVGVGYKSETAGLFTVLAIIIALAFFFEMHQLKKK